MKRLLIGVFVLLFSFDGVAALTYTGLNQINLGRVIRGSETGALSFIVDSDSTDILTTLVITSTGLDFHTTDPSKITDLTYILMMGMVFLILGTQKLQHPPRIIQLVNSTYIYN